MKNIPFCLEQSTILDLLDWEEKVYDQKVSDMLFELEGMQQSVHADRKVDLFLDRKLKEQEKTDYLSRIQSLPESFSKMKFNGKVKTMGTLAIMHNTGLRPRELYVEYKNRGEIEQFFDHFKNTIDASC